MVHNQESEYMDPWIVNAFKPLLVINDYDKYILKYGVVYLSSYHRYLNVYIKGIFNEVQKMKTT